MFSHLLYTPFAETDVNTKIWMHCLFVTQVAWVYGLFRVRQWRLVYVWQGCGSSA